MEYTLKDILFRNYEEKNIEIKEEKEIDSKKLFRTIALLKFWNYKRVKNNK